MSAGYAFRSHRKHAVFTGVILLSILFLSPMQATRGQYTKTLYGSEAGLPFNSVIGITRDDNGFIWVAGVYGICRFDGYRFKEYDYELNNSRKNLTYYPRFMKDSKNRLWVSHNGSTLLLYNRYGDRMDALEQTRNRGFWCDLSDDGEGTCLVTDQGLLTQLCETGERNFSVKEYEMPGETGQFVYMHRYEDGTLIVTAQNGLFRIVPEKDTLHVSKLRLSGPGAGSEPPVNFQTRFLIVGETVFLHKQYEILKTSLPVSGSFSDSVIYAEPLNLESPDIGLHQGERIYSATPGENEEIFLRSMNGIYRYHIRTKKTERIIQESYGSMDAMEGIFQEALYYDPDGILWAGTDHGLLKIVIRNKPFHTLLPDPYHPEGLRVGKLNQVLVDHEGYLWIGTTSDGLYRTRADEDGTYRVINHFLPDPDDPASIHSDNIGYLFEDSQNRLWVRSENLQWMDLKDGFGVFHYSPASFYADELGTRVLPVNMLEDPEGNLIVAVRGSYISWLITASAEEAYALLYDSAGPIISGPYFCKSQDGEFYCVDKSWLLKMKPEWMLDQGENSHTPDAILAYGEYTRPPLIPWAYPKKVDSLLNLDTLSADLTETMVITGQLYIPGDCSQRERGLERGREIP